MIYLDFPKEFQYINNSLDIVLLEKEGETREALRNDLKFMIEHYNSCFLKEIYFPFAEKGEGLTRLTPLNIKDNYAIAMGANLSDEGISKKMNSLNIYDQNLLKKRAVLSIVTIYGWESIADNEKLNEERLLIDRNKEGLIKVIQSSFKRFMNELVSLKIIEELPDNEKIWVFSQQSNIFMTWLDIEYVLQESIRMEKFYESLFKKKIYSNNVGITFRGKSEIFIDSERINIDVYTHLYKSRVVLKETSFSDLKKIIERVKK